MKTHKVTDPQEALEITRKKQLEADYWAVKVDKLVRSLKEIQRENGFAPRMALAYKRSR